MTIRYTRVFWKEFIETISQSIYCLWQKTNVAWWLKIIESFIFITRSNSLHQFYLTQYVPSLKTALTVSERGEFLSSSSGWDPLHDLFWCLRTLLFRVNDVPQRLQRAAISVRELLPAPMTITKWCSCAKCKIFIFLLFQSDYICIVTDFDRSLKRSVPQVL